MQLRRWVARVGLGAVLSRVPVIAGEIGENDCGHDYIDTPMPWLDAHGASYLAWTWHTWDCSGGPALISSCDGTPTAFGAGYRNHLTNLVRREVSGVRYQVS